MQDLTYLKMNLSLVSISYQVSSLLVTMISARFRSESSLSTVLLPGGYGYIDGDLIPDGGGGRGAAAKFRVDASGAILSTYFESIDRHGGNFTSDPFVNIFFRSSRYNQVSAFFFGIPLG